MRAHQRRPGQTDRQAAAAVRGGRRRPPDAGQQRRDAGQPALHPPARRASVPRDGHVDVAGHLPGDHHRRRAARRRSTRFRTALPFTELLALHGVAADQVRGVLMGGYFAGLLNRDVLDATLDHETMRGLGSGLGCGAIAILTDDCPVAVAASVLAYFDRENAGQCGSCFNGTAAMAAVDRRAARRRGHRRGPGPAGALVGGAARPRRLRARWTPPPTSPPACCGSSRKWSRATCDERLRRVPRPARSRACGPTKWRRWLTEQLEDSSRPDDVRRLRHLRQARTGVLLPGRLGIRVAGRRRHRSPSRTATR